MDRATMTLRFLAAPTDAGYPGHVSAGRVLEWIDKAGYACAVAWSGSYSVTAYVGNVSFTRPVQVGDIVEAAARIVQTGRSSMNILVTVRSGTIASTPLNQSTECLMIFVATDANGRPTPVPTWTAGTEEDHQRQTAALQLKRVRSDIEEAMATQRYTDAGSAPRIVLRFLAAPTDINLGGKVHGGIVMRWIDEAAHALVTRWTGNPRNVAVYAGGVRFYRPLLIGHLVEVEARLLHTGATSSHISVHVRSGELSTGKLELTTHCLIIFVALDAENRPVEAPSWVPLTEEDKALDRHARDLIRLRKPLATSAEELSS
jgi:acyl-CoA hydrolase